MLPEPILSPHPYECVPAAQAGGRLSAVRAASEEEARLQLQHLLIHILALAREDDEGVCRAALLTGQLVALRPPSRRDTQAASAEILWQCPGWMRSASATERRLAVLFSSTNGCAFRRACRVQRRAAWRHAASPSAVA